MKMAISGAHRTGKSTLLAELSRSLPGFSTVDEPYHLLEEEGHEFAEMPSLEDFELQLERSIESLVESEESCLFDRCPADILAYLLVHEDSEAFDVDRWLARVREAMEQLDLIIFVSIENPDRVSLSASDHKRLRRRVDEQLRDIVLDDRWGFGVPAIEVAGPVSERVRQVLAHISGPAR